MNSIHVAVIPASFISLYTIEWIQGALCLRVKRSRGEADYSHLVPKSRIVDLYLHSQYVVKAWFYKHRDNFTVHFLPHNIRA
jgi:hypothetical protein